MTRVKTASPAAAAAAAAAAAGMLAAAAGPAAAIIDSYLKTNHCAANICLLLDKYICN